MYVDRYLITNVDCDGYPVFYFQETLPIGDYIDCEDNIQYFMEVAAISDSTDFHQVFILNRGYVNKDGAFVLSGSRMLCLSDKFPYSEFNAHKATIEEIYNYYQS